MGWWPGLSASPAGFFVEFFYWARTRLERVPLGMVVPAAIGIQGSASVQPPLGLYVRGARNRFYVGSFEG